MIVSNAQISELNAVLAAGIPVFVVAYFAARLVPDNFADLEQPPELKVPETWRSSWRHWLVDTTNPRWTGQRNIEMDADFQTRSDRNLAVTAPSGIMASLFSIALAPHPVGRYFTAVSVVLFALLVSSVLISATQASMLRLQLSKRGESSTDPFMGIVKVWIAATATSALGVGLALLVIVP